MAETLSTLSIISFAVAGISFVIAIFFWFFFGIPTIIGDLTGRTARKSIAKMRAANEKTGSKSYKESKTNVERGKLTDTMPGTEKASKKSDSTDRPETGMLVDNMASKQVSEETGFLDEETTGMLDAEATGLLNDEDATAPLSTQSPVKRTGGKQMKMFDDIVLIHTDEVIE